MPKPSSSTLVPALAVPGQTPSQDLQHAGAIGATATHDRRGSSTRADEPMSVRAYWALVLASFALATFLRSYRLGRESLWNDELSTIARLHPGPLHAQFWERIAGDVHPPGYQLLMWAWVEVFGDSAVSLRVPSVLAGVSVCVAVFVLARRYLGAATALAATSLAAVSPLLIEYSQEARSYSLVALLSTLAGYAWLRLLESDGTWPRRVLWSRTALAASTTALASYTHYSGLVAGALIASLVIAHAVLRRPRAVAALALGALLSLLLYAPWIPALFAHLAVGGASWMKPATARFALSYANNVLPSCAWGWLVIAGALGASSSSAPSAAYDPSERAHEPVRVLEPRTVRLLLVAWPVLLVALFYFKSRWSTPICNTRNLIVAAPFLLIAAGDQLARGARQITWKWLSNVAVACALVVFVHVRLDAYYRGHRKEQFREAAAQALAHVPEGAGTKVVTLASMPAYFQYYLDRTRPELEVRWSSQQPAALADMVERGFASGAERVLVLWGHVVLPEAQQHALEQRYRVAAAARLHGAGYLVLLPR